MDTATTIPDTMYQIAPYPAELASLVSELRFRDHLGWRVWLENDYQRDKPGRHSGESRGLTLIVERRGPDTYDHDHTVVVDHFFAVPPSTYNRQSWMWWLFERLGSVDQHERMEEFVLVREEPNRVGTEVLGTNRVEERPYAPCHGPGWDPYLITVERTAIDRRTSFRGDLNDE